MEKLHLHYDVEGNDFIAAGEASGQVKRALRQLGIDFEVIRRCAICMYEGEINMVVHADGGTADVIVEKDKVTIILEDRGPGISDMELAMQEGYSTASQDVRELGFGAGMGLPNMKKYSDSLEIDSTVGTGTKVTMVIHIPG
ncbi:MAG TPA: anti-sigma regulatory factor [Clostridiales bacterium]|jgi:anti-sigma regulatory factor (Ser/Thr protein kinase)|nr:anti-sigma regulatory factor [Clostridiales bacterium]